VIDGRVEAELVLHIRALLGAARDADRPRAGDLGKLADQRSDRSTRRRDDHRLPGRGLTDHAQAAIRGEPGHPEYAEPRRDRRDGRIELAQVRAIRQRVRAPSRLGKHDVAFRVAGMLRGDHRRNGFAIHDTTEQDRLRIRFPVIHTAAHIRVERKILHAEQNLSRTRRRDRGFLKTEIAWLRAAVRSCSEDYLASDFFGHVDFSFSVEGPSIMGSLLEPKSAVPPTRARSDFDVRSAPPIEEGCRSPVKSG
jgi:hypothetical protein